MKRIPLREHLRAAYASCLDLTGVVAMHYRTLGDRALILMYHRVLDGEHLPAALDPGMYVTQETFERHLKYLAAHHDVIALDELSGWRRGERRFTKIPCVITFDDGWADNYIHAFPLLRQYDLPATVFVVTDAMGAPDMLTWEQVREMEATGLMMFGSHTATHPTLTTIDEPAIEAELSRSLERLRRETQRPSEWFCYPKGAYNETALRVARGLYVGALSTEEGAASPADDPHHLPRIGVHDDVTRTTSLFACRLVSLV